MMEKQFIYYGILILQYYQQSNVWKKWTSILISWVDTSVWETSNSASERMEFTALGQIPSQKA